MFIFYGIENPYGDLFSCDNYEWIEPIVYKKTPYDVMRDIAEDVEFEEIEIAHEDRKIEAVIETPYGFYVS